MCVCVQISATYEDTNHIGLGPTLMTSFKLNYFFKDLISKYHYILRYQKLGFQHMNLGRTQFSHNSGQEHRLWNQREVDLNHASTTF